MKKILAVLMAVLMVASLAACGGNTSAPATEPAPAPAAANTTAPAAETTAPEQSLIDAAKAEGELVVYGSCEEDYLAAACAHFEELYGIKVQYQRLSTGEVQAKIEEENGNPSADAWFGGTTDPYNVVAAEGLLEAYEAENASHLLGSQYRDPDGYWYGIYKGILGFMVNKDELERMNLEAPADWQDLLKPEYKDLIWLSNYNTAGTAKLVINTMVQMKGHDEAMKYFVELDKNIAQYTKSGSAAPNGVALGEAAIALTFSHDGLQPTTEGYPIELSFPTDGTGYEVGAMALIKGGKADEQENAKKFIDFMCSAEGQNLYAENNSFRVPTNSQATPAEGLVTLDSVAVIDYDAVWAAEHKDEFVAQFEANIASSENLE